LKNFYLKFKFRKLKIEFVYNGSRFRIITIGAAVCTFALCFRKTFTPWHLVYKTVCKDAAYRRVKRQNAPRPNFVNKTYVIFNEFSQTRLYLGADIRKWRERYFFFDYGHAYTIDRGNTVNIHPSSVFIGVNNYAGIIEIYCTNAFTDWTGFVRFVRRSSKTIDFK